MASEVRQQALLNEYKGNLFEYLVAHFMARSLNLEFEFLSGLSESFRHMLSVQESFIREYYPNLLSDLPILASKLSADILEKIDQKNSITKIELIGKAALAAHDDRFGEGDLLIHTGAKVVPVSLKISKAHAYVNTKSGGLKSFIAKYLNAPKVQDEFNLKCEKLIEELIYKLYGIYDLELDYQFKNWIKAGLPELPGQLENDERLVYKNFLFELNAIFYQSIFDVYSSNRKEFLNNLFTLLGFSDPDIIQATTYYKPNLDRYDFYKNIVESSQNLAEFESSFRFCDLKESAANFDLIFPDRILQLRIKAMNKFTSKSFKVNCSVKVN